MILLIVPACATHSLICEWINVSLHLDDFYFANMMETVTVYSLIVADFRLILVYCRGINQLLRLHLLSW